MSNVILKNVVKRFGSVTAVDNLSITIQDREFAVLVGPSGCGKTTALRMIAGLETITSGEIYIGDTRVNDMAPKDRDIAMVFQNYALYPHMNVRDNMGFGLKFRKVPKAEIVRRVQEAADILGIHDLLERKPKELSGGQRQRVAVGRAIVRKPEVFLFDEPLSNLDAKLRVATDRPFKAVVLDAESVQLTDTDGADILVQVAGELKAQGMTLVLARRASADPGAVAPGRPGRVRGRGRPGLRDRPRCRERALALSVLHAQGVMRLARPAGSIEFHAKPKE